MIVFKKLQLFTDAAKKTETSDEVFQPSENTTCGLISTFSCRVNGLSEVDNHLNFLAFVLPIEVIEKRPIMKFSSSENVRYVGRHF